MSKPTPQPILTISRSSSRLRAVAEYEDETISFPTNDQADTRAKARDASIDNSPCSNAKIVQPGSPGLAVVENYEQVAPTIEEQALELANLPRYGGSPVIYYTCLSL